MLPIILGNIHCIKKTSHSTNNSKCSSVSVLISFLYQEVLKTYLLVTIPDIPTCNKSFNSDHVRGDNLWQRNMGVGLRVWPGAFWFAVDPDGDWIPRTWLASLRKWQKGVNLSCKISSRSSSIAMKSASCDWSISKHFLCVHVCVSMNSVCEWYLYCVSRKNRYMDHC